MSSKKIILSIVSAIISILVMLVPNLTKAATPITPSMYFGINEFRTGTRPENIAYAINNPLDNGSTQDSIVGAKIWQIVKYENSSGDNYTTGDYYCVRAGVGFDHISTGQEVKSRMEYNMSYDLKADKQTIANSGNSVLQSIVNNGYYYHLLALTDLLYLKNSTTAVDEKAELMENAKVGETYYEDYPLTDSDIEAVQQAAIWYFTNHDDALFEKVYNNLPINKNSWFQYRTLEMSQEGEGYTSLSDYKIHDTYEGQKRQEQAVKLYRYLINTATTNAKSYEEGTAYSRTKITLYTNSTVEDTQPIVLLERIPDTREFDLALRKYITSVGGVVLTNTRVPNIDTSTIETDGTATYKHRKDPILVTNGSVVTYNLTVYNEGDKAGRATKIVDQLPTGLKSNLITGSKVSSTKGNEYIVTYDTETNKLTLETEGTQNLNAFDGKTLDSDTIELECTVTAIANTSTSTILTNVAWIAEEYDAVSKIEITNQAGKDRDSEPATEPQVNKDNMSNYKGNNQNKTDLTDSAYFYKGEQDDDDFEKLIIQKQNEGSYDLILVKQDENGEQLNSKAIFKVNEEIKEVTGSLIIADDVKITSDNVTKNDKYVIEETVAPDGYCKFDGKIEITVTKELEGDVYKIKDVQYKILDKDGIDITSSKGEYIKVNLGDDNVITIEIKNYQFDLKLIKRIVEVNGDKVPERIESVDITNLANGTATTADYKLNKNPVSVKKGDIVKYTFRVYNEGGIDGYASEISEDIPDGLEFVWSEETDKDVIESDTTLTELEKEAILYNQLVWSFDKDDIDPETNKVELIKTDYLAKGKGAELTTDGANLIKAFDKTKGYKDVINDKNPDYKEVSVYLRVTSENKTSTIIRNEAAITEDTDSNGNPVNDRDSDTEKWVKYEDDEDYDNVILQSFDLALRKFIVAVSADETIEDTEYLKDEDGTYTRAPIVDTSKLNTIGEDGKFITTAEYNHTKEPLEVSKNDYVVYMLRVYNEGDIDGYASEIKDYLPPYLQFIDNDFNKQYGWKVSEDGRTLTTNYLDNHVIAKAEKNDSDEYVLSYKEVPIMCRVTSEAKGKITNIADITEYKDEDKVSVNDRDSEEDNVVIPSDEDLPNYKDDEKGNYIPGQEDDDDFEKVVVKEFDLALRKFITAVGENEVTTRVPQVKYDENNNKLTYEHTKDPVDVVTGNIVTYTIRVYNEGELDGYASEVSDDIPDGLRYLPEHELNKEYRWVMYDEEGNETEDISKAVKVTTDYLSKEQGEARMAENEELTENPALLKAFDKEEEISETNPDYADVKIAFEVVEPNESSKIIVNAAQISEDTDKDGNPVDDIDSTPDEWIEGEDDQDNEYIKLNYFDLALRKWVTHAIIIEDGKETVTETGHKAEDDPEQVVKVELHRKKINSVTVKFKYSIRVTNEGDIAGYVKEITDYVPEGLKFIAEDNPDWIDEGNNVISTRKLENTLLQPGESAEVQVILTWINGNDNMGLKVNTAEISEDYNEPGVPDRDSTPDNKVQGEDDIDDAPVLLSVSTGRAKLYLTLGLAILITIASGIVLIKKFVI